MLSQVAVVVLCLIDVVMLTASGAPTEGWEGSKCFLKKLGGEEIPPLAPRVLVLRQLSVQLLQCITLPVLRSSSSTSSL